MSLQTTAMLVKKLLVDDNIQLVTNKCDPPSEKGGLTQSVSKAFMFKTRLKPVSNARRLKCNETRLHVFQTPDLL